jgi:hypothetical protein
MDTLCVGKESLRKFKERFFEELKKLWPLFSAKSDAEIFNVCEHLEDLYDFVENEILHLKIKNITLETELRDLKNQYSNLPD